MQISGLLASIGIGFGASFIFATILYWLDLYEKEPFLLLAGTFLWGAVISAGGAFILNTVFGTGIFILTGSEAASSLTISVFAAPIVEEILKGFAVFLVFVFFRAEFDSVLDGIIYAGVVALGFAATENAFYIYTYGFLEGGWAGLGSMSLIRIGLVGWQHPFYTAFFGIGLAVVRLTRNWFIRLAAPAAGQAAAILAHAIHNLFTSLFGSPVGFAFTTFIDWVGWFLMVLFILIILLIEGQQIKKYLKPEVIRGTLTEEHYQQSSSALKLLFHRILALFEGNYRQQTQLYRTAAELAIKLHHLERFGDEQGNIEMVDALREKLSLLSKSMTS